MWIEQFKWLAANRIVRLAWFGAQMQKRQIPDGSDRRIRFQPYFGREQIVYTDRKFSFGNVSVLRYHLSQNLRWRVDTHRIRTYKNAVIQPNIARFARNLMCRYKKLPSWHILSRDQSETGSKLNMVAAVMLRFIFGHISIGEQEFWVKCCEHIKNCIQKCWQTSKRCHWVTYFSCVE